MKKSILNIGTPLDKAEQKAIVGSGRGCTTDCECYWSHGGNDSFGYVCYNPTGQFGICVQGIYTEPPCGF
ncbi:hypothetical protein [Pseudotenacibaculum haliotis]|uniref:Natural product n=1 Tax=Pseudotenacibaculum haliotis TaxID=1862138 RepID=A0ABW5LQG6_9FLAO